MAIDARRRDFIRATLAVSVLSLTGRPVTSHAATILQFAPAQPFSFDMLKQRAHALAASAHVPPPHPASDITGKIDYATHGQIKYRVEAALAAEGPGNFPITFFHLGKYFQKAVGINTVDHGVARQIIYRADYFDMPADSIARRLPEGAGFAGFRIQEKRAGKPDWRNNDWVAFLGASYFRAIGELYQYGLSGRADSPSTLPIRLRRSSRNFPTSRNSGSRNRPNPPTRSLSTHCSTAHQWQELIDFPCAAAARC
jgi:glucans biosynthesis protein